MKRLNQWTVAAAVAAIFGAAALCVACSSGHRSGGAPSSGEVVVHLVPPVAASVTPSSAADHNPAGAGGMRVSATGHNRTAVATTDPSGAATFHLPRGTYTIGSGCGGQTTVRVAGKRPLPVRVMCPPP